MEDWRLSIFNLAAYLDSILIMTNNGNNKTMIDDASFVD
ncbi:unnamed protein product [Arabidopsis halleri]